MTRTRSFLLDGVHIAALVLLTISILCGRVTFSRLGAVGQTLQGVEVANVLLFLSLLVGAGLLISGHSNVRFGARSAIVVTAILFFLASMIGIDALAHRSIDNALLMEVGRVLLTVITLFFLLDSGRRFSQLLAISVALGLMIAIGDFVGWRLQRLQLLTGLSTSRIDLFVLGAAVTLYIGDRRNIWLAAISMAVFTLLAGSMKIGMIAAAAAVFILFVALFSTNRFVEAIRISAAILAGIILSVATGDIDNTLSRVEAVRSAAPPAILDLTTAANVNQEVATLCQDTQSPVYCMNPFLVVSDSTERLRLFAHATELIARAPFLGLGQGAFKLSLWYKAGGQGSLNVYHYPHNLLLDIAVTHGLVGMACLLLLLSICLVIILSTFSASLAPVGLLIAAASVFVTAMTGGDFYDSRYIYICAMLAALAGAENTETTRAQR